MNWFDGNVVEAIQISKSRKSIFLVCIIGNFFIKLRFCPHSVTAIDKMPRWNCILGDLFKVNKTYRS